LIVFNFVAVNKRVIILVISLMSISLVGIILVQYFWMKNAIEVKERQFTQNVNMALSHAIDRLHLSEEVSYVTKRLQGEGTSRSNVSIVAHPDATIDLQWTEDDHESNGYIYVNNSDSLISIKTKKVLINDQEEDFDLDEDIEWIEDNMEGVEEKIVFELDSLKNEFEKERIMLITSVRDSFNVIIESELQQINEETEHLNELIDKMVIEIKDFKEPVDSLVSNFQLKEVLEKSFKEQGIEIPFEFAVYLSSNDSVLAVGSQGFNNAMKNAPYKVGLFSNQIFDRPEELLISFPGKNVLLMKSILGLVIGSTLFTLIILITFILTIRIILKQKRVSEIKSDFINNMTHEFKTPIATISLAVDSMNNPKAVNNPEKVKYFSGIISEENKRMNSRVENVLQMSLIDKQDFNFNIENVDVHSILESSISVLQLQLQQKGGLINKNFDAEDSLIYSDKNHLRNIFINLIDNAIKYSKGRPSIEIRTKNKANGIAVIIKDRGLGMSKEAQSKIFDRFYRVSSGDIHNVKGFGLGLSYVKAIVLALSGKIEVRSEKGVGSEFEIFFPLNEH
jgi:two-component system phosphate regulon sensor histidine kinase PhoR